MDVTSDALLNCSIGALDVTYVISCSYYINRYELYLICKHTEFVVNVDLFYCDLSGVVDVNHLF